MIDQHSQDVITGMAWALSTLGGILVLLAAWGGRKVLDRLDNIERLLAAENGKLREMIHDLDRRVVTIEGHCSLFHNHGIRPPPPDYNPDPVKWRSSE